MRLRGFPLKLAIWLGPLIYLAYMKLVFFTSRKSFQGVEPLLDTLERGESVLAATWHQDALLGPYAFRHKNIITMASLSRDGELLARAVRRCGFTVFRGSSSRRAKEAIRELAQYLKSRQASFCALAADGPKGPARKAKKGIVFLAKHSGAQIFPIRCGVKRRILNKSWDQTTIPLPFNRLVYLCGEPVSVSSAAGKNEIEAARVEVENRLNELTDRIERHFGRKQTA
jgi:lysophospholipid acyltransferase (LPLAT)-like uncharacterized protein